MRSIPNPLLIPLLSKLTLVKHEQRAKFIGGILYGMIKIYHVQSRSLVQENRSTFCFVF